MGTAMLRLRNNSSFLALVCTFLIINGFVDSIHGKSIEQHKRSVDHVIADLPSTTSVDDPQVKQYAKQGIDKLTETKGEKAELEKIIEATFFPPAGKLIYEIKIKVKDGKECTVNVWRESGPETSVTVDCGKDRRRRDSEPITEDNPTSGNVDDPQVKKYVQQAINLVNDGGKKAVLDKIVEVTSYPPAGKLMHEIKIKLRDDKNPDGTRPCTVRVSRESERSTSVEIECLTVFVNRGECGMNSRLPDKPTTVNADDPEVKRYIDKAVELSNKSGSKSVLDKVLDVTYFPPSGKLMYEIKIKLKGETDADHTKTCTAKVWRESRSGESIEVECMSVMRKRSVDGMENEPADKPTKGNVDDPEVRKYVQRAIDAPNESGPKFVLDKILNVTFFPSAGKLMYEIDIKLKNEADEFDTKNCQVLVWRVSEGEPGLQTVCTSILRKRSVDGMETEPADKPTKGNVDDPEVRKYVQKAIDLNNESGPKSVLDKILEVTSFPPAGKLMYEIKMKLKDEANADDTKTCKVSVWREGEEEPTVQIECMSIMRKRSVDGMEAEPADKPTKGNVDDPEIRKYVQKAIDVPNESGPKFVLDKILNVTFFPSAGKLMYEIDIKLKNEANEFDTKNCQVLVWRVSEGEPGLQTVCTSYLRKRSVDGTNGEPADMPSNQNIDDPQVKQYAQKGIDKLNESGKKSSLHKIVEATFFPPAGKLMYEIRMRVKVEATPDDIESCKVKVWRESEGEPTVDVECLKVLRKRAVGSELPRIADAPVKLSEDNPRAIKFAEMGIKKYAETMTGSEMPVLVKILEAYSFAPVGKVSHKVKILMGMCPKGEDCKPEAENQKECTVLVWRNSGAEPTVTIECGKERRRRDIVPLDMPMKQKVDDPQVKQYAQQGIDKLNESGQKAVLGEISEAMFFPPAGKLMYEIKMKVKSEEGKDDTKECTVHVMRESGPEVSIHVECDSKKDKRAVDEMPQMGKDYIADLPGKLDVNDDQVKKYAQDGLAEYAKKFPDSNVELVEIIEAYYVPVSIYSYNIKVKFGKKACKGDCKSNDMTTEVCNIYIPQFSAKVPIDIKCGEH